MELFNFFGTVFLSPDINPICFHFIHILFYLDDQLLCIPAPGSFLKAFSVILPLSLSIATALTCPFCKNPPLCDISKFFLGFSWFWNVLKTMFKNVSYMLYFMLLCLPRSSVFYKTLIFCIQRSNLKVLI